MNNSTQAQRGFQTFVLTLSISLILFSVIYYFVTNSSSGEPDIAKDISREVPGTEYVNPVDSTGDDTSSEKEITQEEMSVFKALANQEVKAESRAVLAGGDMAVTTVSTAVPDTGVTGITIGLVSSLAVFIFTLIYISRGPRNLALGRFERQFFDD